MKSYRKKNEKIVYILGAGFSKDAGGLLMNEFLSRSRLNSPQKTLNKVYPSLKRFMQQSIKDCLIGQDWNIENFFNIVSEAELLDLKFKRLKDSNWNASQIYRYLVDCIANELLISMSKKLGKTNSQIPHQYLDFARKCLNKNATIITFNWDHIPEWLLLTEYGQMNYCLEDVKVVDRSIGKIDKGIKLLKLHGSVNWLVCENSNHHVHIYNSWLAHRQRLPYCKKCKRQLYKMIIPPVWYKRGYAQRIAELWEIAADELCIADRIVIIGYSLPSLDFSAKHLLLLSNYLNRKVRVDIINGPDFNDKCYKQVFKYSRHINNTKLSFEDYINSV